jgi:hypothetical protein
MEAKLVVEVALELSATDEVSQPAKKPKDLVMRRHVGYAWRRMRDTASANRCQLSVSACSCFLPSAVSR